MKDDTLIVAAGRDPARHCGVVNPPVYRASTILYPTVAALEAPRAVRGVYYGRNGTPTTFALEDGVAALEGGARAIALGSGKTAITSTLLALLERCDHLLVADSVYAPTRMFCSGTCASADSSRIVSSVRPISRENTTEVRPCLMDADRQMSSAIVELWVGIIDRDARYRCVG